MIKVTDPDPAAQKSTHPTGSGSSSLHEGVKIVSEVVKIVREVVKIVCEVVKIVREVVITLVCRVDVFDVNLTSFCLHFVDTLTSI